MGLKTRKGKLQWKKKRANHGRLPGRSVPKTGIKKSNK